MIQPVRRGKVINITVATDAYALIRALSANQKSYGHVVSEAIRLLAAQRLELQRWTQETQEKQVGVSGGTDD